MKDETAVSLYESARERFRILIVQEKEAQEQISHWGPILEKLAALAGEDLPSDVQERIEALNKVKPGSQVEDLGLTDAIRWVFKQPALLPLTPTDVRDRLAEMGFDLSKYAHMMPPIHNTLKRMKEAGEIREVPAPLGLGKAFEASR
jgi:hypothetical protein